MKITHKLFTISALLGLGLMLFGVIKTSAGGELDGVEYWAVCRELPAHAHWTSASKGTGTWMEIPQTQTAYNVWTPSPIGGFNNTETSDEACYFVCDTNYTWNDTNKTCDADTRTNQSCAGLPSNANWNTVSQITQTWNGTSWLPSLEGVYNTESSETECRFKCNAWYDWDDTSKACKPAIPTITITDGTNSFTIMDRNLWATEAGTGPNSYGHYFQWGNNYGFWNGRAGKTDAYGNEAITLSSTKPNASGYGPETVNGYYHSATFITAESDWSSVQNDNLRSGSFSDGPTTIPTGADAINRQGACPVWYHIPSQGEWNQLLTTWASQNGVTLSDSSGYKYFSNANKAKQFANDLLLPLAGSRYFDTAATVYGQGSYAYYWSSSPSDQLARYLSFDPDFVYAYSSYNRAYGFPVRCFQDSQ